MYARLAALAGPEDVRAVITLGRPFANVVRGASNVSAMCKKNGKWTGAGPFRLSYGRAEPT